MWALHRIDESGEKAALEKSIELSKCGDPMVEGYAVNHLEKFGLT